MSSDYPVVSAKHQMLRKEWICASRACGLLKQPDNQKMSKKYKKSATATHFILLAAFFVASNAAFSARAQSRQSQEKAAVPAATPAAPGAPSRYQPSRFPKRAAAYYGFIWGVDSLSVRSAESGEVIRFSHCLLDAEKGKALNDKRLTPQSHGAQMTLTRCPRSINIRG